MGRRVPKGNPPPAAAFPRLRCPLCAAERGCSAAGRGRAEYPTCWEPQRGTPSRRVRELLGWCARRHRLCDPRLQAVGRVVSRSYEQDAGTFSNIFDPSLSWDREGWHCLRFTYEFPGYRGARVRATRALLELCAPFGDRMIAFATRVLRPGSAACVNQVLFGLAYDSATRFRVKLYLQFADEAATAAVGVVQRVLGRSDLGAALAGQQLHLLGVDLGPRGVVGAKLYLRRARVRLDAAADGLCAAPLLGELRAAGVEELRDVLAIHRLGGRAVPVSPAPEELDFAVPENELRWSDLRGLPSMRRVLDGDDAFTALERSFRVAVRRVSVPAAARFDKLNLYYVLTEPADGASTPRT